MKLAPTQHGLIDLQAGSSGIIMEDTLYSSIVISLLTDRRAHADDELPTHQQPGNPLPPDRRGWCGDALADIEGDRYGSRLWLLERAKQTEETRRRAIFYCKEALQWIVDDGHATSIEVTAAWAGVGRLNVNVAVTKPDGSYYTSTIEIGAAHGL